MAGVRFLPKEKIECYSPRGIRKLFGNAIKAEGGDIKKIFKKREYKKLIELWYASFLALSIRKHYKKQYCLCADENPDVHFLDQGKINTQAQEGFTLEATELFYCFHDTKEENQNNFGARPQ